MADYSYAPEAAYWRTERIRSTVKQTQYEDDTPFMRQNMGYLQYQLRQAVPYKGRERRGATYDPAENIDFIITDQCPLAAALAKQTEEVVRPLLRLNEMLSKYNLRGPEGHRQRKLFLQTFFRKKGQGRAFERYIYGRKLPQVYKDKEKVHGD